MVETQWNNELYIVCGNRRLKALQEAFSRGMRTTRIDCIVHDLSDNTLGELKAAFLCKLLSAMTTNTGGRTVEHSAKAMSEKQNTDLGQVYLPCTVRCILTHRSRIHTFQFCEGKQGIVYVSVFPCSKLVALISFQCVQALDAKSRFFEFGIRF